MAYATVEQLSAYLPQANTDDANTEALLSVLERAGSIVDGYLGFSYAAYGAATTKRVFSYGTSELALPPHEAGSVTAVSYDGTAVTGYETYTDDAGREVLLTDDLNGVAPWSAGRYVVTAKWGYGPVPARVVEVVLEVAVNIWASKEAARFSAVVGVEGGGAVQYEGSLTPIQRLILDGEKARFREVTV